MRCESCQGKTEVKNSRHFYDAENDFRYIERRRWCVVCDHKFNSIEVPQKVWKEQQEKHLSDGT
jgi:transcriptional regulator NrdR family protein